MNEENKETNSIPLAGKQEGEQVQVYYKEFSKEELQKAMQYFEDRRKKAVQIIVMLLPIVTISVLMSFFKLVRGWIPDGIIIAGLLISIGTAITISYVMYTWFLVELVKYERKQ